MQPRTLALTAFCYLTWGMNGATAIPLTIYNSCSTNVELYNNTYTEIITPGSKTTRFLEQEFSGMFRNVAEFSVSWGFLWYDISIIPVGPLGGPGYCTSLENCKAVTGGVGFNTPIQIAPSGCTTITCLADGCHDAYQYPTDDFKTRSCPDTTPNVDLVFCPGGSGGATTTTQTATQTPPQPPAKTNCPPEFSNVDSRTWYDISIIPAGGTGPGSCSSLEDCKAATGGVGFNVPMQIVPSAGGGLRSPESCRVLSCLEDGCDDAYQFPDQDAKTHSCSADVEFQVIFCATNATESPSDSAADFWVDVDSSKASTSDSNSDAHGSDSLDTVVKSQSTPDQKSTTDNSGAIPANNQSVDSSSSSSTAIYVSTGLVGAVVVIVGVILVYRRRQDIVSWWEARRLRERSSSDTLVFVEAKDDVAMM
ncbi:hypothetical protein PHYBOEH_011896 [Phytophthora boehmeriae]|uniref:Thaumatin-like protein n=1 Tax=Phytophthora boehmeriae TaxID=109152 RepID=A0A8T1WVV6_9STRA|nr:hypothetical protein PHYBOEH_011896 [Phytophthora boehmeriae]